MISEASMLLAGSFAVVWISTWLLLMLLTLIAYRWLRPLLHALHPGSASAILLMLCAAPFLMSLGGSVLLYLPGAESTLVGAHCHEDCAAHVPVTASASVAVIGLLGSTALILLLGWRLLLHLRFATRLTGQLRLLSENRPGGYRQLDSAGLLVFTLGWLKPDVYVSRALRDHCEENDLRIILAHEQAHRRRLDNLRMLLGRLLCAVAPVRWKERLLADLALFSEQACDFAAARQFGCVPVASALVRVKRMIQVSPALDGAVLQRFTGADLEERVRALLGSGSRVSFSPRQLAALALLVLTCIVLGVEPLHHATEWVLGVTG